MGFRLNSFWSQIHERRWYANEIYFRCILTLPVPDERLGDYRLCYRGIAFHLVSPASAAAVSSSAAFSTDSTPPQARDPVDTLSSGLEEQLIVKRIYVFLGQNLEEAKQVCSPIFNVSLSRFRIEMALVHVSCRKFRLAHLFDYTLGKDSFVMFSGLWTIAFCITNSEYNQLCSEYFNFWNRKQCPTIHSFIKRL